MISSSWQAGHVVWVSVNLSVLDLWISAIHLHIRATSGKCMQFQQWRSVTFTFIFFFFKEKLAVLLQSALSGTCWQSGLPREAFMFPSSRALLFRNLTSAKTHAVNSIKVSDHLLIYAVFQPAKFVSIINAFTPASCLPFEPSSKIVTSLFTYPSATK